MKHLLLLILFSGSLDGFSQVRLPDSGILVSERGTVYHPTPDTLRAICLITLGYRNLNVAHARMGFVVIQEGKKTIYLDCRKRALKLPQVGWRYEVVGGKE